MPSRNPYGADLYNQGQQIPTSPGGGDPRVSAGTTVSVANLAGLVDVPLLDDRGVQAEGQAARQIGQGIGSLGENMLKLSEMQGRALTTKRVSENERLLVGTDALIKEEQIKSGDETKWLEIANKHISGLPTLPEDLSPDARDQITATRASWEASTRRDAMIRSAEKSVRDADADLKAGEDWAVFHKKKDLAYSKVDERVANGALTPKQGELEKIHIDQRIEQVETKERAASMEGFKNQTIELAKTHPPDVVNQFIETNHSGAEWTPEEKEYLKDVAASVARDGTAQLQDDFANGVADRSIWNPEAIKASFGASPYMTPAMQQKMEMELSRWKTFDAKKAKEGPQGMENFTRLYNDALSWNPKYGDPKSVSEFQAKMLAVTMLVPEGYEAEIKNELRSRFGAKGDDTPARPEIQRQVSKTMADSFENGLGRWKAETKSAEKAFKDAYPDMASEKAQKSPFYTKWKESSRVQLIKQRESYAAQAEVEKSMRAWYQTNPDKANDPQAVQKELMRHLPNATLIYGMEDINSLGGEDVTTSGNYIDDGHTTSEGVPEPPLPNDPGEMSDILLPR